MLARSSGSAAGATPTSNASVVVREPAPRESSVPGSPPCCKGIISHPGLPSPLRGLGEDRRQHRAGVWGWFRSHLTPSGARNPTGNGVERDQAPVLSSAISPGVSPGRSPWPLSASVSWSAQQVKDGALGRQEGAGEYVGNLTLLTALCLFAPCPYPGTSQLSAWTHHYHCLRL